MTYEQFLQTKRDSIPHHGFTVKHEDMNNRLFDFQKFCVSKAVTHGKFALFEDCGLGKTIQQLEWCNQVSKHEGKPVIILTPLAVSGQTIEESQKFGYNVVRLGVGSGAEVYITNYEQLDNVDEYMFCGVALDESSILKNFEGKMRNQLMDKFQSTPYKSCWTATPSPNDATEIGNHAEFLNVMTRNEMLSMYFIHDGGNTSQWRLKKHAEESFYQWMATWSLMISRPSDIGFSDEGYILPDLNIVERIIETHKRDNGLLFNDISVSATNFNAEIRLTLIDRIDKAAEIVNSSPDNFIIWIKQDAEGDYLKKVIPDAIEVRGSDKPEMKEKHLLGFARNEFRVLATKTKIAQFGLNYQNCHNQIFASLDFSFESLYQAIRRSLRFGQLHAVNIYIITTDTMQNVLESIHQKQEQFNRMQDMMVQAMRKAWTTIQRKEYEEKELQLPTFINAA